MVAVIKLEKKILQFQSFFLPVLSMIVFGCVKSLSLSVRYFGFKCLSLYQIFWFLFEPVICGFVSLSFCVWWERRRGGQMNCFILCVIVPQLKTEIAFLD